mgnify:CR=1 FL=1
MSSKSSERSDRSKLDAIVNNEHNVEEHRRKVLREDGKDAPPLEEFSQKEMEDKEKRKNKD